MEQNRQKNSLKLVLVLTLWVFIAVASRVITHITNKTPLTAMSVLAGGFFMRRFAIAFIVATMLVSDVLVGYFMGYPIVGSWTVFTYSGFLAIVFVGGCLGAKPAFVKTFLLTLLSGLGFWLWTNVGTWLFSGMYPRTGLGLMECYSMALPFLRNSLIGVLIWTPIFYAGLRCVMSDSFYLSFAAR